MEKYVIVVDSGYVDGIEVYSTLMKAYKDYLTGEREPKDWSEVKKSIDECRVFFHKSKMWETRIYKKRLN